MKLSYDWEWSSRNVKIAICARQTCWRKHVGNVTELRTTVNPEIFCPRRVGMWRFRLDNDRSWFISAPSINWAVSSASAIKPLLNRPLNPCEGWHTPRKCHMWYTPKHGRMNNGFRSDDVNLFNIIDTIATPESVNDLCRKNEIMTTNVLIYNLNCRFLNYNYTKIQTQNIWCKNDAFL